MAKSKPLRPALLAAVIVFCGVFASPRSYAAPTADTAVTGPRIVAPAERVVIPNELQIVTTSAPEGYRVTEVEIRDVSDGELGPRVWSARRESGGAKPFSLEDGRFEPDVSGLAPWDRYALRARHGSTTEFTPWGPERVFRTDDGSSEVFDDSMIREIRLEIPESSWQRIDDEALSGCVATLRDYYVGTVTIDGKRYPGSGIRAKGGCGSSRLLDGKAAFKANMSWDNPAVEGCPEDRRHKGLKKITLNNQVEDPSYLHERIGYEFFSSLDIPVPRAAPVSVFVNDEPWGLYLHLETIDRRFLARRFDSNDGMLYEGDYGCDLGEAACFEPKFDTDACDDPRDGDPTDMTPLETLHERLALIPSDDFYPAIQQVFDFDRYLTTWAAGAVMGYWDGYPSDPTNYRIYHDPSNDRWTLVPSGIDQLFEKNVDPFKPVGMLSIRCLADADCEAAFRARLAEVIALFEDGDYSAMARRIARQIRAAVETDPRKEISFDEWRAAVEETVAYIERRPGELRALLAEKAVQKPEEAFHFHALTDPSGKRFIFVTWTLPGDGDPAPTRWLTAKGYFEQLNARLEAVELVGGSSAGKRIGTVTVDFVDCKTAHFSYAPDSPSEPGQDRTARIDSEIWKYCD